MKKNSKISIILVAVIILALAVGGCVSFAVYDTFLKPADFSYVSLEFEDMSYRHNFDELTDEEKYVYAVILEHIYEMPEEIEIPALGGGNLNNIFSALSYDNPELFFMGDTCKVYRNGLKSFFKVDYTMSKDEYVSKLNEVKGIANSVAESAKQYTSVYERELFVHDYIINHTTYVELADSDNANNIYGCLVEGKAACEGYSRAFQYIMNLLGVDNRLVTGEGTQDGETYEPHMWNYVVIDNAGYFVDLTWDDPTSGIAMLKHTYFNITTNDCLVNRRNIDQTLPLCTSTKYNYFVYENILCGVSGGDALEVLLENAVNVSIQRKYNNVELRFTNEQSFNEAKQNLFQKGIIYNVYKNIGLIDANGDKTVYYTADDDMYTICLFF